MVPALFTRVSIRPNSSTTCCTAEAAVVSSVMSASTVRAAAPLALICASSSSSLSRRQPFRIGGVCAVVEPLPVQRLEQVRHMAESTFDTESPGWDSGDTDRRRSPR